MSRNPDFDAVMIKKTELERLEAEIARLRAALLLAADHLKAEGYTIEADMARRALEPKP